MDNDPSFAAKLMQDMVVPTFVLDAEGRVLIWNAACERLTGVKASEVIGTKKHWQGFYEEPRPCLADILVTGETDKMESLYASHTDESLIHKGLRAENWCVMPKAETRLYLAINAGGIYDENGELCAVIETLRDMTKQIRAEEALKNLANKDGLTGLANRRAFDAALDNSLQLARQGKLPIALLLGDIDHFKPYNDIYGHQKGDECLTKIGKALKEQAGRPTDLAARYGGEEFAIILPTSNMPGALEVGKKVLDSIYKLNIEHKGSETADRVTMSMGVASLVPDEGVTAADMIKWADEALYEAKETGRNQIVAFKQETAAAN